MPLEKEYGCEQDVMKGHIGWLPSQICHYVKGMEAQMIHAYSNIKKLLTGFDMKMDDVVEEVLYVLDMPTAFEAGKKYSEEFYPVP
jgi:2-iminobutanoate/2-iminopropanoate deaminase